MHMIPAVPHRKPLQELYAYGVRDCRRGFEGPPRDRPFYVISRRLLLGAFTKVFDSHEQQSPLFCAMDSSRTSPPRSI